MRGMGRDYDLFETHTPEWARVAEQEVEPVEGPTRLLLEIVEREGVAYFAETDLASGLTLHVGVLGETRHAWR